MRSTFAAVAMLVAGCSSEPAAFAPEPSQEAGVDARVACGLPGEAVACPCAAGAVGLGRCQADGRVDPCVCAAVDAGTDVDATADVEFDAREDAAESSPDVAPVDARNELERSACLTGAPRMTWTDAGGCVDEGLSPKMQCRFRIALDGKARCMPRESSWIGGYADSLCAKAALNWSTEPVPAYMIVDGQAVETRRDSRTAQWYRMVDGVCTLQAGIIPLGLPPKSPGMLGDTIYIKRIVPDADTFTPTW
jgi:hypothetical protein